MLRDLASCNEVQELLAENCLQSTTCKRIKCETGDVMKNPASLKTYSPKDSDVLPDDYALLIYEFVPKDYITLKHSITYMLPTK